jgi:hypothetical protein
MRSGCGRRPPDWLRSNDRLQCFEVDRAVVDAAYATCPHCRQCEDCGESQIGQSLGQRAICGQIHSAPRVPIGHSCGRESSLPQKTGHRREKVGGFGDLAPGCTANPPRSVRPRTQQTASDRCRRCSPRTCQVRCRREPGARRCFVVAILGWINPPGSLPQAGRNREEDRHEWRKGRARRLGPDPDEFGQYETGPAPQARQPSLYIGASNVPRNDRLARGKYRTLLAISERYRSRVEAHPASRVDIIEKTAAQYQAITGHPVEARCPGAPAKMNGGPGALSNQCDRWLLPPRPL